MAKEKRRLTSHLSDSFNHELFNRVLICALLHSAFCFAFFIVGVWEMGVFNIFSIALFALLGAYTVFSENPKVTVVDTVSALEYVVHTIFAVYYTGNALGFQFILFALAVPVVVITRDKGAIRFSFFRVIGASLLFVAMYELCAYGIIVPKYTFSPIASAISTFSMFAIIFVMQSHLRPKRLRVIHMVKVRQLMQNHIIS